MDTYELKLCGVKRELPFIDLEDNLAFASFVIMGDTELITACAPELAEKIGEVDVIITAEAKGIALAYEISRLLGKKEFIVARKSIKSYMCGVVSVSVHSITTSGEQHLYLDGHDAKRLCGKRVCIVDDVISTGESLYALEALVESAKGIVTRKAAVLAEGKAAERDDIIFYRSSRCFTNVMITAMKLRNHKVIRSFIK